MRLYTRTGASALTDPATGIVYEADEQGGFNFPDDLSDGLRRFAVRGQPMWEDDIERQRRMINEELERRKDPATLLDAVQQILSAAKGTQVPIAPPQPEPVDGPEQAKPPRKRAAAKSVSPDC
ncbi:hypothetical protein [Streptacidiphilus cavernicola]|uniref:Tail assembly chaperone n=1 Tax=Streptacidiphilus cavernicola TaxID=3342716 RepID=A0ABV6VYF3_9ACTN